jgi:hypothetical protein
MVAESSVQFSPFYFKTPVYPPAAERALFFFSDGPQKVGPGLVCAASTEPSSEVRE